MAAKGAALHFLNMGIVYLPKAYVRKEGNVRIHKNIITNHIISDSQYHGNKYMRESLVFLIYT